MTQSQSVTARPAAGGRRALIGALILGAIAAGLIVAFLARSDSGESIASAGPTTQVIFATQDIPSGTTITRGMLEERNVPNQLLVAGSLTRAADAEGEVARYPIAKGEQIGTARLVEAATAKSVSVQIPKGLRGFTVEVSITKSPAALISPGDYVDVIVSGELVRLGSTGAAVPTTTASNPLKAAVTLLQNVQVLSVQRNYVADGVVYDSSTRGQPVAKDDDVTFVTLIVTPEQAQLLWLAGQEGEITVTLRPFGDEDILDLPAAAEPIRIQSTTGARPNN
jgi:pilus assembly protein CpaB